MVFYGRSPNRLDRVRNIKAPVLPPYGEKDAGVNQDIPAITVEAMKQYNRPYNTRFIRARAARFLHRNHR
jgi:dienelactone hydrolase